MQQQQQQQTEREWKREKQIVDHETWPNVPLSILLLFLFSPFVVRVWESVHSFVFLSLSRSLSKYYVQFYFTHTHTQTYKLIPMLIINRKLHTYVCTSNVWSPFISLVLISCLKFVFLRFNCVYCAVVAFILFVLNLFVLRVYIDSHTHAPVCSRIHHFGHLIRRFEFEFHWMWINSQTFYYPLFTKRTHTHTNTHQFTVHRDSCFIWFRFVSFCCLYTSSNFLLFEIIINWMCFVTVFGCGFCFSSSSFYAYSFRCWMCVCVWSTWLRFVVGFSLD